MKLKITVMGVEYEVDVEVLDEGEFAGSAGAVPYYMSAPGVVDAAPNRPAPLAPRPTPGGGDYDSESALISPVAGTVVEVKCKDGDQVKKGQTLIIIEAMKMHTNIAATKDTTVGKVSVNAGEAVREGQILVEYR